MSKLLFKAIDFASKNRRAVLLFTVIVVMAITAFKSNGETSFLLGVVSYYLTKKLVLLVNNKKN